MFELTAGRNFKYLLAEKLTCYMKYCKAVSFIVLGEKQLKGLCEGKKKTVYGLTFITGH